MKILDGTRRCVRRGHCHIKVIEFKEFEKAMGMTASSKARERQSQKTYRNVSVRLIQGGITLRMRIN